MRDPIVTLPYHHRQHATVLFWSFGIIGAFILVLWLVVPRESLGSPAEVRIWNITLLGVLALFAAIGAVFRALDVTVDRETLEVRFGPIRKRLPVGDIREAAAVRNRWYYGFGIRWTPHGWLWNVSGLDAVEIGLANGKSFRIGTSEPQRLAAAIREAANRPAEGAASNRPRDPRDRSRSQS